MEDKKQISIITDEADKTQDTAKTIAGIIESLPENRYFASIVNAENFSATDLQPAVIFFIGCETPKPASFSKVDELFEHINFAGRSCGIFAQEGKALEYLTKIVNNTEASVSALPLEEKTEAGLKAWIEGVIERCRL